MTRWILVLTLVNFVLLVPGVFQPIYSITITSQVDAGFAQFDGVVFERTRSILGAIRELASTGDYLVSFLILFFSIVVPVTKASMLVSSLYVGSQRVRAWLLYLVDLISKWSMADVFVIGVFLAFLATENQGQQQVFEVSLLGQDVEVAMGTTLTSKLGPGFYFFLSYCVFSIAWTQVLKHRASSGTLSGALDERRLGI